MPSQAPAVAAQSDSPRPPESIRLRKEAAAAAAAAARANGHAAAAKTPGSRRGSTASWLHPLSSTEMPNSDVPCSPLFPRNGHATGSGDYPTTSKARAAAAAAAGAGPSPLQGFEVELHRARATSGASSGTNRSENRSSRGYAKLTGLLTRRSKEGKPRRSVAASNRSGSQLDDSRSTLQPMNSPESGTRSSAPTPTTTSTNKTPSTATSTSPGTAPNPLQRSGAAERTAATTVDSVEVEAAGELQLDEGGYHWPAPPSPSTVAGSHGRASVSRSVAVTTVSSAPRSSFATSGVQGRPRRELSVSPLILRNSPHATLRRDGTSTPSTMRTASPGLNTSVAQFVPLGSADLADGNASSTHLQRSYNFSGAEEEKSTASVSQRHRSHRPRLVSASSLSNSTSQSLGLGASTRFSQTIASRQLGDTDASVHASLTARSLRDAKSALLRRAQPAPPTNSGGGGGARVSRQHSFHPSHSNTSLSIAEPGPPSRSGRGRPSSRETRPGAGVPPPLLSSGRAGSPQSMVVVDDEAVRTGVPQLLGFASPVTHPALGFPVVVTAPTLDASSARSVHNLSVSNGVRRLSRTEDNPLLEVMETSALASQGGYELGGGAPWWPSITGDTAQRGRHANGTSAGKLGADRRTTGMRGDESGHLRSSSTRRGNFFPTRSPSGCFSPNRTSGYDSDEEDRDEEVRMRERHRSRVDEVLRQLNATMRSNAGDERGGNGAASGRNNLSAHEAASGVAGTSQTDTSNTSGWAGIGGGDWGGGLAAFGDATGEGNATASTSTATAGGVEGPGGGTGGGGGGWLGVGGGASSDDWYTRMRKRAQEEEAKATAAAAAAATVATPAAATTGAGTSSNAPLPTTASAADAPRRPYGEDEGCNTATSSVATCAATHAPAAENATPRRPSVQFVSRRVLTDRATPNRRPMTSAAAAIARRGSPASTTPTPTPTAFAAASTTATGTAPSTPSTVTVLGHSPPARQPTKPTTSPTAAAAARERFTRRTPSNARLQLSQTAADVAKPDGGPTAAASGAASQPLSPSAQRAAMMAGLESPETTPARTRFQPATTSVPVHRAAPQGDAGRAAPLPPHETAETYRRLSGMASVNGSSAADVSVSSSGGAGTTAPTPMHPPPGPRSSDGFSPTPTLGSGTSAAAAVPASSYRQFDMRRRCSLPRVLPSVNTSLTTPSLSGPQAQGSNFNSAQGRIRSGVRHSTVPSSILAASLSSSQGKTTGNSSSAGAIPPAADGSALGDRAEGFEDEANTSLRRSPSVPAPTQTSAAARV